MIMTKSVIHDYFHPRNERELIISLKALWPGFRRKKKSMPELYAIYHNEMRRRLCDR